MNERLKELRHFLGLTQKEFGDKIGVTNSAISYLESGRSNLTEQMIFSICLIFEVSKNWLKYGKGEMFINHTVDEELASYMGALLGEDNPQKEKYALIALKILVDEWDLVEKNLDKLDKIIEWVNSRPEKSEMP